MIADGKQPASSRQAREEVNVTTDPVCGMTVDEQKAPATATYDGKTYYFCSRICKTKFELSPFLYIDTRPGGSGTR